MSTVLLSIKPEYAKVILDGQKEYEFRKRRCKTGVNKIVFYSTAPESKVVGEAEIEDIIEGSPSKIWELAKSCRYNQSKLPQVLPRLSQRRGLQTEKRSRLRPSKGAIGLRD